MRKKAKGERYHCLLACKPTQKETQRKGARSRWEEQCYARKGKKGKASLPSPFQFYCSGNPYYQVASCIARPVENIRLLSGKYPLQSDRCIQARKRSSDSPYSARCDGCFNPTIRLAKQLPARNSESYSKS